MPRRSPLDDPTTAAHAWARYKRLMKAMAAFAFVVLGFTPITYPPENLPGWLASIHDVLPFYHMGVIVRDSLTEGLVTGAARSYIIVAAWTVVAAAITGIVMRRRK